jgi:hypothetical protein
MSDAAWLHFFLRTKVDITNAFRDVVVSIIPESQPSRAWNYSLSAQPSEYVELALLTFYILSSLSIAYHSVRLCRLLSGSRPLVLLASVLSHGWAFYGDTWRDVTCALQRRKIEISPHLQISSKTYGGAIHAGLLAASTTAYAIGCLMLFKDMVMARGVRRKVFAYARLCIAFCGLLWVGAIEGINAKDCRSLLSHLMHAVLTNCIFLWVMSSACAAVCYQMHVNKMRRPKSAGKKQ